MSLSAILEAIHAAGTAQVQEIENRAELQIQQIKHHALEEVERIRQDTRTAAVEPAYGERAKILHHARLKALHNFGNVRESLVDTALDQTKGRLAGMRTDSAYPDVLQRLVQEAVSELRESLQKPWDCKLEADLRDQALLESILDDKGFDIRVSYTLDSWGGVIARSQDNRVIVINTLEARMDRASSFLRRYLAAFFEKAHHMVEEKWMA